GPIVHIAGELSVFRIGFVHRTNPRAVKPRRRLAGAPDVVLDLGNSEAVSKSEGLNLRQGKRAFELVQIGETRGHGRGLTSGIGYRFLGRSRYLQLREYVAPE